MWKDIGIADANATNFAFTKNTGGLCKGFLLANKSNICLILKKKHSRMKHIYFIFHRNTYYFDFMRVIESRKVLGLYRNHSRIRIINSLLSDGNDL